MIESRDGDERMNGQRLSVALVVYNGAAYIRDQLDSIAAQRRLPDELIVCDDRSVDSTTKIVEAFASEAAFPVRLVVNEENLGYTKNLEKAISLSTGDIILPCDHDDVWLPEKLGRAEEILSNSPRVGAVFANAELVDEHLNPSGYYLWQWTNFNQSRQRRFTRGRAFEVMLQTNMVFGATMAFRATFKDLVLPIPSTWNADDWISLLICTAAELAVIHEPMILYRQHPANLSGSKAIESLGRTLIRIQQLDRTSHYSHRMDKYALVHERLMEVERYPRDPKDLFRVESKIENLRARAGLKAGIARRLPAVLRELVTLRYHRYANGWKSVAKDLLL